MPIQIVLLGYGWIGVAGKDCEVWLCYKVLNLGLVVLMIFSVAGYQDFQLQVLVRLLLFLFLYTCCFK